MKKVIGIGLMLLLLAGLASGDEPLTTFEGHGMRFDYPVAWDILDGPTGVILGDHNCFAISVGMHNEGCYPLSYHPYLMDFMLKLWADPEKNVYITGTPIGAPIIQYIETDAGPYSVGTQGYENPSQIVVCEVQGHSRNNVTITYATTVFRLDPTLQEVNLKLGRLKTSLVITENQTAPVVQCKGEA